VINDPTVSSFHAQIVRDGERLVLLHPHPARQQTVNGLLYQGQKVVGNQRFRQELRHGDIIRIGDTDGALVTLIFNDGTGRSLDVVPEMHPIPLGAATITLGRLVGNTVVLNHPQVSAYHARLDRLIAPIASSIWAAPIMSTSTRNAFAITCSLWATRFVSDLSGLLIPALS